MYKEYSKQLAIYSRKVEDPDAKRYRTVCLATFIVACSLCALRLIIGLIAFPENLSWLSDFIFSVSYQVCVLFLCVFLLYKLRLKMTAREVMEFSNFRKCKWYYVALAVPLGLCVYCVTLLVSSSWGSMLEFFGFSYPTSEPLPEKFNVWQMLLSIFLTGILPAFCEEFFMRGGLLTTTRKSYPLYMTLIISGVAFGLFHQNITQLFYTALFGALMAFITLKVKSIYPAIVVHFVNNTFSVLNEYFYEYGFMGGGFTSLINWGLTYYPAVAIFGFILVGALGAGIVLFMVYLLNNKKLGKKKEVILDSGFDHTNERVVLVGELDKNQVIEMGMDKEVYGEKQKEDLYKAGLKDNAFVIGAIVVTAFATLSTFIFGLLR